MHIRQPEDAVSDVARRADEGPPAVGLEERSRVVLRVEVQGEEDVVGNVEVAEIARDVHVLAHRAADHGH